ncbi:MAG: protein-methionine-sulfoxide reductase heme-binding subunit MsrQ [SAR92 clade bacterium]|uniref:Protein-methionine-sulfoxide reductase heme-binding subunit MsrQ n=1 Tax=SAR92 clade bacterium TaxID=2315479 RepID=A0A520MEX9_9GAMM|nr:MAG: protein-methionine-sulfoxide reductase heme-binding subunit MsrQ [SAR92 clade bacterium]
MAIAVSQKAIPYLKALVHITALYPLVNLYYQAISDRLGADPVEVVIHFTGIGALNLLLISLLISPAAKFFKIGALIQFRRMIGLYAFFYALCHILNFLSFEVQFDLQLFIDEVFERPYITVGMTAFLLLTALAVTSIAKIRRKMKKNWQTLHNFTYLIALLGVVHFYWSVKSEIIEPLIYGGLYAILMGFRHQKVQGWRKKRPQ